MKCCECNNILYRLNKPLPICGVFYLQLTNEQLTEERQCMFYCENETDDENETLP